LPELPEVETVRKGLDELVTGETVAAVEVRWPRIIAEPAVNQFSKRLMGQTLEKVGRRGKFLLFYFTDDVLISHLRMEGKYELVEPEANGQLIRRTKHTHVIFHLQSGKKLNYLDVRKFGRMYLVSRGQEFEHKSLVKLGPEPTSEEFVLEEMQEFLTTRTKAIKGVLLDQQIVVGVGNIYADEILFEAEIHPVTPANRLTDAEEIRLHEAIIAILEAAVKNGGTTIRSYANAFGDAGTNQENLKVYGREGEACVNCGTEIQKIKVAGRGTHYCPVCQPMKE
jgi:formamidopyrimidine-DNA glycosylase